MVTVGGLALNGVNCKAATAGLSLTVTAVLPTVVAPCRVEILSIGVEMESGGGPLGLIVPVTLPTA